MATLIFNGAKIGKQSALVLVQWVAGKTRCKKEYLQFA